MSDAGRLHFLSWVRGGIAAGVPAGAAGGGIRASVSASVHVDTSRGPRDVDARMHLYGPGDALGLDARQVIRTDPPPNTSEFEPNYHAAIEFDDPALAWMLSPDASPEPAAPDGKLRPWLCLVVIDAGQATIDPATRPLPTLRVSDAPRQLPNLAEARVWAHAQVTGAGGSLDGAPSERTLSRLLSPRRLDAGRRYVACVVPTFLAGVAAGLGRDAVQSDAPAWLWPPPEVVELPVYYSWEFGTAAHGGFEELVRRLVVRDLPETVGVQPLDATDPGADLPPAGVLGLEGALRSPSMRPTPWPDPARQSFQIALRGLLAKPSGQAETLVTPPVYGAKEAGFDGLPPAGTGPLWLQELNLDPRHRAAAGLGARVVERDQEQLLSAAWQQLVELERANQLLRQAQLARALAARVLERRLKPLKPEMLLRVTEPGHSRVLAAAGVASGTVRGQVQASKFPEGAISPPFRRALRPLGPIGRRLPGPGSNDPDLIDALANGRVKVRIGDPDGVVTRELEVAVTSAELGRESAAGWRSITEFRGTRIAARSSTDGQGLMARPIDNDHAQELPSDVDPDLDEEALARLGYIIHNFRAASQSHQDYLAARPPPPVSQLVAVAALPDLPLPVADLHKQLTEPGGRLDPEQTVAREVAARVKRPPDAPAPADDLLHPIAAVPRFPQAMYEPLRRELPEGLLASAGDVPADTVGVLLANGAFIEAYMAGLNTALHDELFWRGFPLDRTGTSFQWFWDARGAEAGTGGGPVPDIPPIRDWRADRPLGGNAQRVGGEDMTFLMIRGELVRRYPAAAIYAAPAVPGPKVGSPPLYPEFRGVLEPDVLFAGFALSLEDARGRSEDEGYYFVIQEPPTAARFGLDAVPQTGPPHGWATEPATWDELAWSDLAQSAKALAAMSHVEVDPPSNPRLLQVDSEGARWGRSAADMARLTFQRPVRVAVHARRLLAYAGGIGERVQYVARSEDRITAIGGAHPNGKLWRLDEPAAIALLNAAKHAFHVEQPAGDRVAVTIGHRHGRPYLKTVRDGDLPNNLLALPGFPA